MFSSLAGTLQATLLSPRQPTTPPQSCREHVLVLQSLSEHLENTGKEGGSSPVPKHFTPGSISDLTDERGWLEGRLREQLPCLPASEEIISIAQESALALVLVNIAIIDSHCGKHCVRIKCDGDTSREEAENLLRDRQIIQNPLGAPGLKIKRQFERGQEDPDCTSTPLKRGAMPVPAEPGVLGRTRAANGHVKRSRVGRRPKGRSQQ